MRHRRTRLSRIAVVIALVVLFALSSRISSARQQDNHNMIPPPVTYNDNGRVGIPYNKACRNRCDRAYRRCLRSGKGRATCRRRHAACLQRCPQ
jgi:hypothetical protein